MDNSELLQLLKDSGSAKSLSKTVDFCGKFLGSSALKTVEKNRMRRDVSEAGFDDANGGRVAIRVWDRANKMVPSLTEGAGVSVVGCCATVADAEVKLNI